MKDPVKNVEDHPNAMHEVLDGFLFQGNGMAGVSKTLQQAHGITSIVNVTKEIRCRKSVKHIHKKDYLQIKVVDVPQARDELAGELEASSDFIGMPMHHHLRPTTYLRDLACSQTEREEWEGTGALCYGNLSKLNGHIGILGH